VKAGTLVATAAAMLAFAANSLLCRAALGDAHIDPASFSSLRVVAGALTLGLILLVRGKARSSSSADWRTVFALYAYVVFFSFAYLSLDAGTGALILFGAVQLTMFAVALRQGERVTVVAWLGYLLAAGGLVYLVSPGVSAPAPLGALLMTVAGVAWGLYSLFGKGVPDPLAATARNFIWCVPPALLTSLLLADELRLSATGLVLAIVSGAITSGLGYVIWYAALAGLTATRAATVQLSVPVIAAVGGVLFLAEPVTLRLVMASVATLGGVGIVLAQRTARSAR
jgi:drug/metabolite transporter (DMT)-like permease